jgi:hypothetical protein
LWGGSLRGCRRARKVRKEKGSQDKALKLLDVKTRLGDEGEREPVFRFL